MILKIYFFKNRILKNKKVVFLCEGYIAPHKFKLSEQFIIERFHSFHSNILGIYVACNVVLCADIAGAVTKNSTQIFDVHIG